MRPSFLYSSTITALALASALARSFFLKHNLHKKAISHKLELDFCVWSSPSDAELPWTQSTVEEGDPQPSEQQEDEHEREGKRKPGAKIDQFAVGKIAERQRKCFTTQEFGRVLFLIIHLRFQLSDHDEVGSGAGQRGGPADAGRIRNTDEESFPHFHLILRL